MFHSMKQSPFVQTPYTKPQSCSETYFLKLTHIATKCVQFCFHNSMSQQIDRISMRNLLGAPLANIFVGFQEARLFKIINLPLFSKWYIDDAFMIFFTRSENRCFSKTISQQHPVLTFTCKFEHNNSLPFLDVLTELTSFDMLTLIHRKPMFTGSYTWWGLFWPPRCKINFTKTLVHRALIICSKPKLTDELKFIKKTLLKNEFPKDVITNTIKYKSLQFSNKPKFRSDGCPVYLRLLWISNTSM